MFNSRSLSTPPEIQTNRGTTLLTKHATRARVLFPDKTIVKHTEHWRKKQDLTQPVFPLLVLVGKDSSQLLATYLKHCETVLTTFYNPLQLGCSGLISQVQSMILMSNAVSGNEPGVHLSPWRIPAMAERPHGHINSTTSALPRRRLPKER